MLKGQDVVTQKPVSQACPAAWVGDLVVLSPWASQGLPVLAFWAGPLFALVGIVLGVSLYIHI